MKSQSPGRNLQSEIEINDTLSHDTKQSLTVAHTLKFSRLPGSFAVCRLPTNNAVPEWALRGAFFSATATADEVSIVCLGAQVPSNIVHENDWVCLKLQGPFPFSETGILSSFVRPLSERAIPIFAVYLRYRLCPDKTGLAGEGSASVARCRAQGGRLAEFLKITVTRLPAVFLNVHL